VRGAARPPPAAAGHGAQLAARATAARATHPQLLERAARTAVRTPTPFPFPLSPSPPPGQPAGQRHPPPCRRARVRKEIFKGEEAKGAHRSGSEGAAFAILGYAAVTYALYIADTNILTGARVPPGPVAARLAEPPAAPLAPQRTARRAGAGAGALPPGGGRPPVTGGGGGGAGARCMEAAAAPGARRPAAALTLAPLPPCARSPACRRAAGPGRRLDRPDCAALRQPRRHVHQPGREQPDGPDQ
jgi:hypothetical protein